MRTPALLASLLIGATLLPSAPGAWAQEVNAPAANAPSANPAAGLVLSPDRYRAVIGNPPAAGSREEADDLAAELREFGFKPCLHLLRRADRRSGLEDDQVAGGDERSDRTGGGLDERKVRHA